MMTNYLFCSTLFLFVQIFYYFPSYALSVKDSTFYNGSNHIPVYNIQWRDAQAKPRTLLLTKPYTSDNYPGICVWMRYYDGNTPVIVKSMTPNDSDIHNRGFGTTVHHYQNYDWHWKQQGPNPTLTQRFKGDHMVIFDLNFTLHGAIETITYTFMDGLDYFQWQQTVQCSNLTDTLFDARGPYSTVDWDGNGAFDVIDGQRYEAKGSFNQSSYNNNWTYTANPASKGVPFVHQWKGNREIGYIQTQTYTQQQSGVPATNSNIPASGTSVPNNGSPTWFFDYQMNFYDQQQKLTWGMPYGFMEAQSGTGTKNGWGQYSLSIVFNTTTRAIVEQIYQENKALHNGNITFSAIKGSIVIQGPTGTHNSTLQTLSPAGYDHNYRAWWLSSNGNDEAEFNFNINSGSVVNPVFRINDFSKKPESIKLNGNTLHEGIDYYTSYNTTTQEAWITLNKILSSNNTILVQATGDISIISATISPDSITNSGSVVLTFTLHTFSVAAIQSVILNLSSLGGTSAQAMTLSSANHYDFTYTLNTPGTSGIRSIPLTITDINNQSVSTTLYLKISSGTRILQTQITPSVIMNDVTNSVNIALNATDDGSISSVTIDLSPVNGSSAHVLTDMGNGLYSTNTTLSVGISTGTKTLNATVTDDLGNTTSAIIYLTVNSKTSYLAIYTDPSSMVCGTCTWASQGTLNPNTSGAPEGINHYQFNYTAVNYYAGFGLNVSNWNNANAKDFSLYDSLDLFYMGPMSAGSGFTLQLKSSDGNTSNAISIPVSATYTQYKIALSQFTGINKSAITELAFSITGTESGSGTLYVDNIRLSRLEIPLSVSLFDFQQTFIDNSVLLKWTTGEEKNCHTYTIERSINYQTYESIYETNCAGSFLNTYQYTTPNITMPAIYRLKQTNINGSVSYYYPTIHSNTKELVNIYPNPVNAGEELTLIIQNQVFLNTNFNLYRLDGTLVATYNINDSIFKFKLPNETSGLLFYTILNPNGLYLQSGKLLVN